MKRTFLKLPYAGVLMLAAMCFAGPTFAEKPAWAGEGKGEKKEHKAKRDKHQDEHRGEDDRSRDRHEASGKTHRYFEDRHRVAIHEYYQDQFRHGRCPPGLAKKNNGCMPPGQAKKWSVGHRLPRDVVYYDVPDELVIRIGRPAAGHRYVRVATDILLIAVGTGMVVDAIQDLGRM